MAKYDLWCVLEPLPFVFVSTCSALVFTQESVLQSIPMLCAHGGGMFLRGLLEAEISITGAMLPVLRVPSHVSASDFVDVQLDSILGLGATSTVFQASVQGQRCAVKIPLSNNGREDLIERAALRRLAQCDVDGVPRIACDTIDVRILVTFPVGRPIAVSGFDVCAALREHRLGNGASAKITLPRLVDASYCRRVLLTLRAVHAAGVIHGDMRLSNLVSEATDVHPAVASSSAAQSHSATIVDFGSAFVTKRVRGSDMHRFKRVCPASWISLPYAHPDVLRAFVSNTSYRPSHSHDLFMFAASLYRLLVPWAPCKEVKNDADANELICYWKLLMAPVIPVLPESPWPQAEASDSAGSIDGANIAGERATTAAGHKRKRSSESDAENAITPRAPAAAAVSPWGLLFNAANAYDLPSFEVAAGNAVRSIVPDWPW